MCQKLKCKQCVNCKSKVNYDVIEGIPFTTSPHNLLNKSSDDGKVVSIEEDDVVLEESIIFINNVSGV